MKFRKYHGTGNDFILFDNRGGNIVLTEETVRRLCHRRFGIGADGLMLLHAAKDCDFEMVYYNSDGSAGAMCGNGGRCMAAFAHHLGIITKKCSFLAYDGVHQAEIVSEYKDQVAVKMSMKDVEGILQLSGNEFFLDTGAPHFVVFTQKIDNLDVRQYGTDCSNDPRLPDRANVNFVEVCRDFLYVRTFERGVEDETLSCGTGVTAVALAFSCAYYPGETTGKIKINTRGGMLQVDYSKTEKRFHDIWLEGPAMYSFSGQTP